MGDPCIINIFYYLVNNPELYNILRDGIGIDPDLKGPLTHIAHGGLPPAWGTCGDLIFFDRCLYVPVALPHLHRLFAELLAHDGESLFHQVTLGLRDLPDALSTLPTGVLFLQEIPHSCFDRVDVRFIDLGGHDLVHVRKVALKMADVAAFPPLATLDYRTLFGHYIDLTMTYPKPRDSFVVFVDGFLFPQEKVARLSYMLPPSNPDTLFGVTRSFLNTSATPVVSRDTSTLPSLHFRSTGGIGNLSYEFIFDVDCTG